MISKSWILPDGINEVLAPDGRHLEMLRRNILDMYRNWGYDYIIPPIVEHLESLLTGTGSELDLQTFKLTDLVSGRLIALRADITPQIARIDASQNHQFPSRYCYVGTVLHTRAFDFNGVRDPLQIGVELFGHKGIESDLEVICLMLETLKLANIQDVTLDLGHMGIINHLLDQYSLETSVRDHLSKAIGSKSAREISRLCQQYTIAEEKLLLELIEANGDRDLIANSIRQLDSYPELQQKVHYLLDLSERIASCYPEINIVFDLAERKGYQYHTGVVFSAYVAGKGKEIARGGRYDEIGKAFGKFRPATGFSTDLKSLMDYHKLPENSEQYVLAPNKVDKALAEKINALRAQNITVVQSFDEDIHQYQSAGFTHTLQFINQQWQLVEIHG